MLSQSPSLVAQLLFATRENLSMVLCPACRFCLEVVSGSASAENHLLWYLWAPPLPQGPQSINGPAEALWRLLCPLALLWRFFLRLMEQSKASCMGRWEGEHPRHPKRQVLTSKRGEKV